MHTRCTFAIYTTRDKSTGPSLRTGSSQDLTWIRGTIGKLSSTRGTGPKPNMDVKNSYRHGKGIGRFKFHLAYNAFRKLDYLLLALLFLPRRIDSKLD